MLLIPIPEKLIVEKPQNRGVVQGRREIASAGRLQMKQCSCGLIGELSVAWAQCPFQDIQTNVAVAVAAQRLMYLLVKQLGPSLCHAVHAWVCVLRQLKQHASKLKHLLLYLIQDGTVQGCRQAGLIYLRAS